METNTNSSSNTSSDISSNKDIESVKEGFVLVDKAVGNSSFDEIRAARRKYSLRRIGHVGTLDPFASGLLILALHRHTKLFFLFDDCSKGYEVCGVLGETRDSDDITGNITNVYDGSFVPTKSDIESLLVEKFTGEIKQMPPIYSAKKVDGKRAYQLARAGQKPTLKESTIFIEQIKLLEYDYPNFRLSMKVSKGTYVRSIVADIGSHFGIGAYAKTLVRTSIGDVLLDDVVQYDGEVISASRLFKSIQSIVVVNPHHITMLGNGNPYFFDYLCDYNIDSSYNGKYIFFTNSDDRLLAVVDILNNIYMYIGVI